MISSRLVHAILANYAQAWNGMHGPAHWARVLENGLRLAPLTGAKVQVVQLFAVFHDAKRVTESLDHGHGQRGADYAASLRGMLFDLPEQDFELLYTACQYHTDGLMEGDITLQTCWDADRLDLGRADITPRPQRLCTLAARDPEVIKWANQRSRAGIVPTLVRLEWGLEI